MIDIVEGPDNCEEALALENCCCDFQVCSLAGHASLVAPVTIRLLLMRLLVLPNFKETCCPWSSRKHTMVQVTASNKTSCSADDVAGM